MYHGEVNVAQDELNSFLLVAEELKVKGLTQSNSDSELQSSFKSEPTKQIAKDRSVSARTEPPPKRPCPPAPRAPTVKYYHDNDDDIQEVVPVKSEPVSNLPPATQKYTAAVEAAYSAPHTDSMTTAVVADLNSMEYEEEYADYGYEGQEGSGVAEEGLDGNKGRESCI